MSTETIYNGSLVCEKCGQVMNPVMAMYSPDMCSDCEVAKRQKVLKGRMA